MKTEPAMTVIAEERPADLETPVSAFLKLRRTGAAFLLESVEQGERVGRYSFIGVPSAKRFTVEDRVDLRPGEDPLAPLTEILRGPIDPQAHPAARLVGGAVGFVSYDYARTIERLPRRRPPGATPLADFFRVDACVAFDHVARKVVLAASESGDGRERLAAIRAALSGPLPALPKASGPTHVAAESGSTWLTALREPDEARYVEAVRAAKEYIRQGDLFQVVLARRISRATSVDPFQVYRALRILNPSPYMFFLDFGRRALVGSSPEALLKVAGRRATLCPIAGTRPRGSDDAADRAMEAELTSSEKERAEHMMLVDLARNDLGRVCRYGTVKPKRLAEVERYSHVMHLVSEVEGELTDDHDALSAFRASFPAGTVSGAPKVRAMERIEELESAARGPYGGAVGYFGRGGALDMCITIRTLLFEGGTAVAQAGAGIVHDSVPEAEFHETASKAAALQRAVEMAEGGDLS